jgi:16S rRNA (cytosine1402-N4)-methyltransferase
MNSGTADKMKKYSDHYPVLLAEVIESLAVKAGGKYLDCTFGAGGYTRGVLESADCLVTALDRDPTVEDFSKKIKKEFGDKFHFVKTNFSGAAEKLQGEKFDGIVLDLGISSMQVDQAERGFSFMHDGPLDMRMSKDGISAAEFLKEAGEQEIANVIYKYGEEVQSRAIANKIIEYRREKTIDTTLQLAEIVRGAMHYRSGKIDPATKTFQAIRIYINQELEALEQFLENVSFHSLEDSIVKNFFKDHAPKKVAKSKYSTVPEITEAGKWLKMITKKPITPKRDEILLNHRSRSAKLRVAEKLRGYNVV